MAKKITAPPGDPTMGRDALEAISSSLNRRYGTDHMLPMNKTDYVRRKKLPFGIFVLDQALQGGIPMSHYTRIWGPKSTLKTTLCLRVLGQAQKTCRHCKDPIVAFADEEGEVSIDCGCPTTRYTVSGDPLLYAWLAPEDAAAIIRGELPEKVKWQGKGKSKKPYVMGTCPEKATEEVQKVAKGNTTKVYFEPMERCEPMRTLYVDTDRTADLNWVEANGVDPSLVMVLGAAWGEQAMDYLEQIMEFGEIDLIVIDSLSGLTPKVLLEAAPEAKEKIAAQATFLKRLFKRLNHFRHMSGLSSRYAPTVLCTSQVSLHGIGGSIPPWLAPSGADSNSDHAISVDIRMQAKGYHKISDTLADYGDFSFVIKKNKVGGSPEAEGVIRFQLMETEDKKVGDSDDINTVQKLCRELGLIYPGKKSKEKAVFETNFNDTKQVYKFEKIGDLTDFLAENETIYMDLRNRLMKAMFTKAGVKIPEFTEEENTVQVQDPSTFKKKQPMKVKGLEGQMADDDEDEDLSPTGLGEVKKPSPKKSKKKSKKKSGNKSKKKSKEAEPEEDDFDLDDFDDFDDE